LISVCWTSKFSNSHLFSRGNSRFRTIPALLLASILRLMQILV